MDYILELDNVTKAYTKSEFVLDRVSFSLPYGAIMGFVGENGAGKTTTISCILNTLFKDNGSIKIFGREISKDDIELREDIGVVFDGDNFPAYLTAERLAIIMRGVYKRWDDSLFHSLLAKFHLGSRQRIKTYSKGMTMKLAIAVALAHHPKLLILDEATGGLDPVMRDEILDLLLGFVEQDDHSILLSSHVTSDLEKVADYITFIHDGKIILTAPKDVLAYQYAIMRCKESQFSTLTTEDIVAYRKRDYQIDVLISNEKEARRKYKDVIIDHATIDEIMLLLVKGERK